MQPKSTLQTRCIERACPFPIFRAGRCQQHFRDCFAETSPVGTAHSRLIELGMVVRSDEREVLTSGRKAALRRCKTQWK
jgi:hypothetical protein